MHTEDMLADRWDEASMRDNGDFSPDIGAYFKRIGYSGSVDISLGTLSGIQTCHLQTVPFENIDMHVGKSIDIDPVCLERKIVHGLRGGYCFELNGLLLLVLRKIGFNVTPVLARVRWKYPASLSTGKTHIVLLVKLDGRQWLVDVAFGGLSPLYPIDITTEDEQKEQHEVRRVLRTLEGGYMHQIKLGGKWDNLYYFNVAESYPIDWKVVNWYTHTHPETIFAKNIIACIVRGDVRYNLMNKELTIRSVDGSCVKRILTSLAEMLHVLAHDFNLHFPTGTQIQCPNDPW